jgi:hypothetical protein
VVVPTRESDWPYIKNNFHTYLKVGAEEVLLCIDDGSSDQFVGKLKSLYDDIKAEYNDASSFRIVKVEKRSDYSFHQAWVRRKGFLEAKNDVILTGDIDLYINKCVQKAVNMVGKDDIGLASVQKFPLQSNLKGSLSTIWRLVYQVFIRSAYFGVFTGLYAVYRPYWLETEDERIKNLQNVKYAGIKGSLLGEDTYLRDCMQRKYRCVYLRCIGAIDFGIALHDNAHMQFAMGRLYFHQQKPLWQVLAAAFVYYHPDSIVGYFYEKERARKGLANIGDVV